jgi:mRNA interferase RelE/StbE
MGYSIEIRPAALKALRHISPPNRTRVSKAIESLAENPFAPGCKKLAGQDEFWRVRVGDYRVIYTVMQSRLVVLIVKIGHRREFYR